ncbi:hypothetical protein RM553_13175 [Zunongwangia sp. F363]|uniref:Beta-carotene 15,15'-monooxygenase n=1 Tax=Autumnicola tepida TaxID=3075595 RepID=A0ABU3CBR7_9FLAO|nr:hypothetical protein [Zunongwangia sp. F363]MDT0643788.1 hypothetical protein [Zunongwangia sp. F363]
MLRDYVWIPIYALVVLEGLDLFHISGFIFHLLIFSIAYEVGYIYTDNISIKKEDKKICKVIYKNPVPENHVYFAIFLRVAVVYVLLAFMKPWLNMEIVWMYTSVFLIYFIYGNLQEKYRVPLFLILRFLKGFIPSAFLILAMDRVPFMLVTLLLFSTACFFSIEYASRKLDLTYINIQLMKYVWLRYLIIFFFLAPYILLDHIPLRDFSLVFTIYVGIHLTMIILSLLRKFVGEQISLQGILQIFSANSSIINENDE